MDDAPGPPLPSTTDELARHGWHMIAEALTRSVTELTLVTHWFASPEDDSVQTDEHFGDNARTATFLQVVVPTLARELGAHGWVVGTAWDLDAATPLMVMCCAISGQRPLLQARALARLPDARTAPWWQLGAEHLELPVELARIAATLPA